MARFTPKFMITSAAVRYSQGPTIGRSTVLRSKQVCLQSVQYSVKIDPCHRHISTKRNANHKGLGGRDLPITTFKNLSAFAW